MKEFNTGIVQLPPALVKELNYRAVDSMRVNTEYANNKHHDGEQWAMSNIADVAVRAWLLYHVTKGQMKPREAMEAFVEMATGIIFPAFLNTPGMEAKVQADKDEIKVEEDTRDDSLRAVLRRILGEKAEPIVAHGDSIDEIIEQLTELRDAQNETRQ